MSTPVFPTRHGDWHLIDGELVDMGQMPPPDISDTPEPSPATTPTATPPSSLPPSKPRK